MGLRSETGKGAASRSPDPEPRWTGAFLRLVATLAVRPRWRDRPLPLIWLTGGPHGVAVLDTLAGRLASPARYRVPHGRLGPVSPPPAPPPAPGAAPAPRTDPESSLAPLRKPSPQPAIPSESAAGIETEIRSLLDPLCRKLSRPAFGTGRLWFRRYALAAWLLDQDLSGLRSDDVPGELARRLRGGSRPHRGDGPAGRGELSGDGLFGAFGAFAVLSWLLSRLVPQVVFRVAAAGRVPGIGRRYRWFMRQHYLAPAQSGTFLAFAERLTIGGRDDEPPDQIGKLLLHAFLEDLRHAYLRRPWRVQSWRRTAYPIVLMDDVVPGTVRHTMLRLINDVRNETGRYDPLLVVCAGDREPRRPAAPPAAAVPAIEPADLESAYQGWARVLPRTRRARGQGAWVWSIDVPARTAPGVAAGVPADATADATADGSVGTEPRPDRDEAERSPGFVPPKPPWFARRTVAAAACLIVGVSGAGLVAIRSGWPDCGHSPLDRGVSVREIGGQCVGLSSSDGFRFNDRPGQEALVGIQRRIFAQNAQADEIWEHSGRRRPLVTLVYLGTLTGREIERLPDEEAYASEREDLEGLAVAQYDGIRTSGVPGKPLLRIVVGNAGFQMEYAREAAKMIVDLRRRDPTLIGVVGLVESRKVTGAALRLLNDAGIPAIASTLSADGMYASSRLYLQVAPPNRDQARLVERYARTVLHASGVRVHYTLGKGSALSDDLYVNTMLADLRQVFGRRLESVAQFDGTGSLAADCGYRGMVFFAGRWTEFADFIEQLSTSCGDDPPRHLVADDSVNRYMANPTTRQGAAGNIPLTYVSKGWLATCDRLRPRAGEQAAGRFLSLIQQPGLFSPPRCGQAPAGGPISERLGLSYDSAMIMLRAVEELGGRLRQDPARQRSWDPRSITPVGIYIEALRQNLEKPFSGVTGDIDFDEHGEPVDKVIFLVQVKSIRDTVTPPTLVFRCGRERAGDPATCRRP